MKIATLGIIVRNGKVLLGERKRGEIGTGVLSSPGGKLDRGETPTACVIRETREELGIELDFSALRLVAVISFFAADKLDFCVYVYLAEAFHGELKETADMIPEWHPLESLPFDRMYESDKHWFLKAARGEEFRANVYYRGRAEGFDHIDFFPFRTHE